MQYESRFGNVRNFFLILCLNKYINVDLVGLFDHCYPTCSQRYQGRCHHHKIICKKIFYYNEVDGLTPQSLNPIELYRSIGKGHFILLNN